MRAGRLREKVTLQTPDTTQNSIGETSGNYTDMGDRRAGIEPLMGKEFYENSGEHSQIDTRIRMRYDALTSTLKPGDRLAHGSNYYDIQSIQNPRERDRELVLMCKLWQSR